MYEVLSMHLNNTLLILQVLKAKYLVGKIWQNFCLITRSQNQHTDSTLLMLQ